MNELYNKKTINDCQRRFLKTRGRDYRPFGKLRSAKVRQDVLSSEKRIAITLYSLKDQESMKMTETLWYCTLYSWSCCS